jgi:hypothetical protein
MPCSNPLKEPLYIQQIWVLLPELPMEFFITKILEGIGNALRCFVVLEEKFMDKEDMRIVNFWWSSTLEKDCLWKYILIGGLRPSPKRWISRWFQLNVVVVMKLDIYGRTVRSLKGLWKVDKTFGLGIILLQCL